MNIDRPELTGSTRRDFFRRTAIGGGATVGLGLVSTLTSEQAHAAESSAPVVVSPEVSNSIQAQQAGRVPWENGKYETFPRSFLREADGSYRSIFHHIDIGTLGPDVDTIFGIDFLGDIPTGFEIVHKPAGSVIETRVVGVKRTDLKYVQFNDALGGDRFDILQVSKFGGDATLRQMYMDHAKNSGHTHQKVVVVHDLGRAQNDWPNEASFFKTIIRAQVPSRLGIPESNFVNPRPF